MTAKHEIVIKFTIMQDVKDCTEILDPHDVCATAANLLCDELTDFKAVTTYEFLEGRIDAK